MKRNLFLCSSLLLALASPAQASTIAFEDQTVLIREGWQLNTIFQAIPNSRRLEGGLSQEIRYGLTDRLMLRTTVPLGFIQERNRTVVGLGDWEFFLKGLLLGDEESTFQAAFGLQWVFPSALPGELGEGRLHFIPSLLLKQDFLGGSSMPYSVTRTPSRPVTRICTPWASLPMFGITSTSWSKGS